MTNASGTDDLARKVARKGTDENQGSGFVTAVFKLFFHLPRSNRLVRKHRVIQGSCYPAWCSD
jgi:hypothetical protein